MVPSPVVLITYDRILPTGNSPHNPSIQVLDDDSILYIFYLYRPAMINGDDDDDVRIAGGRGWDRERWWYKLAHVCQRWRKIILGSPSHLGLCLVCTHGTPVTDMLAYSPPLPIAIDYFDEDWDITAEDEEGIMLALEQQDRVRRVRLGMPVANLQKLIMAIDQEYPVLENLIILPQTENTSMALKFPETFQAPQLRHLVLGGFSLPIGSRLLTTAMGLVTLYLSISHPSAYFQPNTLLRWISLMPQLETLLVMFLFPIPNRDVERQLMRTPIMTQVILPNLRWFGFQGASTYMEAVICRTTTPLLEQLQIQFFNQLTFSVPRLMQFMDTTENLRFDSANFTFSSDEVYVVLYLRHPEKAKMYALSMRVYCCHFDW